ncbi:2-dehydropantoate 2-reductase [Mucilaginibacter dorajii]|uniref:2-dehydropantoate 2-reductase n=2 Tax=Mucilaginibacter dorajii TaxID=692994 RepID=A0ABP7PXG9_9SPHI|nr:ketopantoate reductase C-terminal domain-containing protein [Mucilaginibacter dorajii]MCS3737985.1 2-dehydropantoate 2-reductase [Mucilaginibacter dorajii]
MENIISDFNKQIYIVGNGVIAKALAVALTVNGKKVTILRGSVDDQETLVDNIEVEIAGANLHAEVTVSSMSKYDKLDGIILLTNKSFGNEELARKLKHKAQNSPVVFLQNGLHIENSFIDHGFTALYRCVLLATSQSINDNKVRFRLVAPSPVGVIKGTDSMLQEIIQEINTETFSFRAEADIQPVIWKKVISNCVFNSICPLLEIDNGIFHRNVAALEIAKLVITECLAVAHEQSIRLTMDEVLQNVIAISKMSDGQKISTYQDILNKRETEIETLNFAIDKTANKAAVPVTALLGKLTKLKSDLFRGVESSQFEK